MNHLLALLLIFAQQAYKPADPKIFCKDAKQKALCAELLSIRDRDQIARNRWNANQGNKVLKDEVARVDKENLARIEAIVAKHGYPGKSLVGKGAGGVAWLVMQHADLATQKKYIGILARAADNGELDASLVATTVDRIRVHEGKPQIYGTQFHEVNGEQVPLPIEDEAHVDARRAKVGLDTLGAYTKQLREIYAKPVTACHDAKDKALCSDLLSIEERDQAARTALNVDRQNVLRITDMNRIDHENLTRLEAIIARYGWPGKSLVGAQASEAAWLVIQHSDAATQKRYMPMMTKAADAGELDRGKVAMTTDRVLVSEGKPQLYGSAFKEVKGEFVPEPIQDEANLDARRKEAGLPPFAEFAARLKQTYSPIGPQPKKAATIVARVWRGRVPASRADEYAKYLYDAGLMKIRGVAGNLGAEMLRRTDRDVTEFIVISYWLNRESIRAFAGEDLEKAQFLPRDREFLINPDEFVRHYDVTSAP